MPQGNRWLLICCLLLSTITGCGKTQPQATSTPQATLTPQPATTPQAAPVPASPLGAWKTITGNGVSLSLPASYQGGNPSKDQDLDAIAQKLKTIDPEYEKNIESLKENASTLAFVAFDLPQDKSKFVTNVNIAMEKVPDATTVEKYLNAAVKEMSAHFQVTDQKVVSLDKYQAGRIVAEDTTTGTPIKYLFYLVQKGNNFWIVTYTTATNEFDQRLPNFEKSIRTFTLSS